jgi:methylglutaconyl-CoA hydratase
MNNILRQADPRGVVTLTLNRPEVHNAFNLEVIRELQAFFRDLDADPTARVVVLRGEGKSFSAGADLDWMKAQSEASPAENRAGAVEMAAMFAAIDNCRHPVVAVIQGAALGGGTGLTCAADIAIAAPNAMFGFTEVRLGIVPAVISPYAIRRLGFSQARAQFLLGGRISAEEALRMGLVHYLAEDPEAKLEDVLQQLLFGSPAAQGRIKALVRHVYDSADPTDYTVDTIAEVRAHPEAREGFQAFFEKRKPSWQVKEPLSGPNK